MGRFGIEWAELVVGRFGNGPKWSSQWADLAMGQLGNGANWTTTQSRAFWDMT